MPAYLYATYADGSEAEFELKHGSNVIGKKGGAADLQLESASLSRKHAMITVGANPTSCTVEDLGSTNKSHILDATGQPNTLNPGTVYPLSAQAQLICGDVQLAFEFVSHNPSTSDSAEPDRLVLKTAGTSAYTHEARGKDGGGGGKDSVITKSLQTSVMSTTGKRNHRAVYEHGKEALGMSLPYDQSLLWIAEASLNMPLPEGWEEERGDGGQMLYKNLDMNVETDERPQTLICRNLYRESRRKLDMEEATGLSLDEERLPRLLLLDPATGVNLFHYVLPGRNTVGKAKDSCDIWLNSKACSKQHGFIEARDSKFYVGDLGSTNGTFVGQLPSTASRKVLKGVEEEVTDGQLIMFGDVECSLSAPAVGGLFTMTHEPGSARSSASSSDAASSSASSVANAAIAKHLAAQLGGGGGAGAIDYDEIRKIIREEVGGAVAAAAGSAAALRGLLQKIRRRRGGAENDKLQPLGDGPNGKQLLLAQPLQMTYDVDEELRLADELSRVEAYVGEHVNEVRHLLGVEERVGLTEGVPSRRKGFLARQEQRRQLMIQIGKRHYRKQAPYSELGPFLLPTGALHRVLTNLAAVPYLCLVAPVCKQLRDAAYCTQGWTTDNGDYCPALWGRVILKGMRCADGHTLLCGLGPERLGFVKEMDLSGVLSITDDTLALVAEQCPLLEFLYLNRRVDIGPQITDIGVEDIAACCPRLRHVSMAWCSKVSDASLIALASNCPLLEVLHASFCHSLTDKGLLAVLQKCKHLTTLDLEACDRISEQCIVALAQLAPRVKTLSLAGCSAGATTMSVIQIARACDLLSSIDLTGIAGLQDAAVWQLSRGCRWLQYLYLSWCVQLSDVSFAQIARNCPLIVELHVRGCDKLTDAALVQIATNCAYLRVLDIRGCPLVSQSGLDALAMMVPSCRVLFIDASAGKR